MAPQAASAVGRRRRHSGHAGGAIRGACGTIERAKNVINGAKRGAQPAPEKENDETRGKSPRKGGNAETEWKSGKFAESVESPESAESVESAESAKSAGIPFILLEDGYTEKKVSEIYHNHLIKDFVNIEEIVNKYLNH